jgi:RHS repeat-associated protein
LPGRHPEATLSRAPAASENTWPGAENFDYDALGRLTLHDSELGTFTFAYLGEADQLTTRQLSGANVATTWSYLGNAGDRRLAAIDNDGFVSGQYSDFTYDTAPEDLITGIQTDSDAAGATPDQGRLLASYNNLNQLTRFAGQRLTYDANGNLISDGERDYAWDAENRLIGITYPDEAGKSSEFTYDGLSRRVGIEDAAAGGSPTTTASYLWCGAVICQARDASNNLERLYFPEGEFVPGSPGTAYHYGVDQIGSVRRAFIDSSTAPAFEFDPYGAELLSTPRVADFGFAGMFSHDESGLYLTQYRAYDPQTGRWLSRDPLYDPSALPTLGTEGANAIINLSGRQSASGRQHESARPDELLQLDAGGAFGGANTYWYVNDSPTNLIDPSGLQWIIIKEHGLRHFEDKVAARATILYCMRLFGPRPPGAFWGAGMGIGWRGYTFEDGTVSIGTAFPLR